MYDRTYGEFEWDARKEAANRRKHGIRFSEATTVFLDERGVRQNARVNGEHRIVLIGSDELDRILVVVWTQRDSRIRIISARKANARERAVYGGDR